MEVYGTTHHHQKKRTFEIRNVATQSPNKRVFSSTIRAQKQNYSLDGGRVVARRQLPTPKIERLSNMLPLIFQTGRVLSRLVSSPVPIPLHIHVLVCSQMLTSPCQTEICRGHSGGAWGEPMHSVLQAGRVPQSSAAGDSLPLLTPLETQPLPQPLESLRGHPVIRCPSDVFTFSLTADTSGAHIQVTPVPLDTFHKIISAVVMAIFLPPVIFKLHDRNSWS